MGKIPIWMLWMSKISRHVTFLRYAALSFLFLSLGVAGEYGWNSLYPQVQTVPSIAVTKTPGVEETTTKTVFTPSTSQKRARAIMGKNYFGIEEAIQHFGVNPTRQQLDFLSKIPFSEADLNETKDSHILVAVFPLSILDVRDKVLCLFWDLTWYNDESFANNRGETKWHLVRKTPVEDSINKTYQEQQALLFDKEEVPSARVMVYTVLGYYMATGERLFENVYVRCSDCTSVGGRVYVGHFGADGLSVGSWDGGGRYSSIGLAPARKFL